MHYHDGLLFFFKLTPLFWHDVLDETTAVSSVDHLFRFYPLLPVDPCQATPQTIIKVEQHF